MNYTLNPTTFIEGTYGFIRNQLAGGNESGILVNDSANRLNGLAATSRCSTRTRASSISATTRYQVMKRHQPGVLGRHERSTCRRVFALGQPHRRRRRRTSAIPGFLNINRTQDFAVSMTKVAGRHTMKAGFYNNHSYKAQNIGAGGVANLTLPGLRRLRQRHQQPARHGLRLRERRDRRVHAVPAAVDSSSKAA